MVLPPLRPSAAQVARIAAHLKGVARSDPVAVLGSTPEFRDLLYELGFRSIHVFDRSERCYAAMSRLRAQSSPEVLEKGDWLESLARFESHFGAILSDLTSGNVPYADRATFYGLIARALRGGGFFCDKLLSNEQPLLCLDELLDSYAQRPLNLLYINAFVCEVFFCSELLRVRELVDASLFYEVLRERARSPRQRAFVWVNRRTIPPGSLWYYGRPWQQLSPGYCAELTAVDSVDEERWSPFYGRARTLVFRKPLR
jgi:hypothetical protein